MVDGCFIDRKAGQRMANVLKIRRAVGHFLKNTREGCAFKKAWLPEGWACVNIEQATEDLTRILSSPESLDGYLEIVDAPSRGGEGDSGG